MTISIADHRGRHHGLNLLRHDTNIGALFAIVAEAIEAQTVCHLAEKDDVVLEGHVGPSSAATATPTTAASSAAEAAASAAATAEAAASAAASAEAAAAETAVTARSGEVRRPS